MDAENVTVSVNDNKFTIEVFTGSNFKKWKQDIMFAMTIADMHSALIMDKPADLTAQSTEDDKLVYAAWLKSNHTCLLSMRRSIEYCIRSSLPDDCTAKEFMDEIARRYCVPSAAKICTLLQGLINLRYDGSRGVRDYVMRMVDYRSKLEALDVSLPISFIVHRAVNTLPAEFRFTPTRYRCQGETWSINELISTAVVEEEILKKDKSHVTLNIKKTPFKKDGGRCFFCKKMGHKKKDCTYYK